MANTGSNSFKRQSSVRVPRLYAQVDKFYQNPLIHGLTHGQVTSDPTADNLFDWTDPRLLLFTRDMTQDIMDMNPVIVLQRYLPTARNYRKFNRNAAKRWVVPGMSVNNGEPVNAGDSSTNTFGVSPGEVQNFIPFGNTPMAGGYRHHINYSLPVSRFTNDRNSGAYLQQLNRAVYSQEWNETIGYSQHRQNRNYYMIFKVSLGIPNPDYVSDKSLNQYIIGEGQTIIVYPRLQTFNDGSGNLEYYIAWSVKVRE